jgi:hypothetical protein
MKILTILETKNAQADMRPGMGHKNCTW